MDDLRKYYLELASRVCDGITPGHLDEWLKWAKANGILLSPWLFISSKTGLSVAEVSERISPWHMEHGKRVEEEWENDAVPLYKSPVTTDKLSVEKLQEELESCIQTLIEASVAATITQDIVVGNLVDRKLADLAKTHKLAVDYIEKVTGKNIDVVLAENAALEAEEE
uniref:hypothetical protein n=1 Tax=Lactococcus lactis TaxID=1358 RepID=UPI0003B9FC1C|nr:hypothetical protein [Lactococcus lactis]